MSTQCVRPGAEIELTPAVIRAGAAVYRRDCDAVGPFCGDEEFVADVFSAMLEARVSQR